MQGLKILVVVMGLLIITSMGLLGWGFYSRLAQRSAATEKAPIAAATSREFGEVRVDLPAGCTLREMRPHADRIYLRTGPEGLCERIVILDSGSGRVLGSVVFRP